MPTQAQPKAGASVKAMLAERIEKEWSEDEDGYWMQLRDGWTLDDATVIHELTRARCLTRLIECKLAPKAGAPPTQAHTPSPRRMKPYQGRFAVYGPPHPIDGGDYAPLAVYSNEADARLSASAPETKAQRDELLAMVKDYADTAECGDGGNCKNPAVCWHCQAVALVARAESKL